MENKKHNILIVAGEASGDGHAAKLVKAISEVSPETEFTFFGAAGSKMRSVGVEAVVKADELSIVGLPEIAKALPMFLKAFRDLKMAAVERKADAIVLVDFPDFNLKLAKTLKKMGFKVIYYISPQLWAWRKYRLRTIRDHVDLLITILPFEKDWYSKHGIGHVEYVGNPLAMEVHAERSKLEFCEKYDLDPDKPVISLLPGSRHKEIVRILPVLLKSAALMSKRDEEIQFIIASASPANAVDAVKFLSDCGELARSLPKKIIVVNNDTYNALNASDAAAVTSGTATLETGIIGTPMAIVYKTSTFNYKLLRPLISVEHFGLINLIAGERVAKELIQDDLTPQTLADELFRLLQADENKRVRAALAYVTDTLGHGGASKRAAEAIFKELQK